MEIKMTGIISEKALAMEKSMILSKLDTKRTEENRITYLEHSLKQKFKSTPIIPEIINLISSYYSRRDKKKEYSREDICIIYDKINTPDGCYHHLKANDEVKKILDESLGKCLSPSKPISGTGLSMTFIDKWFDENCTGYEKYIPPVIYEVLFAMWLTDKIKEIESNNKTKKEILKETIKKQEKKPLSVCMNWKGENDEELKKILTNLRGDWVNFSTFESVISGDDKLILTGSNIHIDALVIFYVLAETGKIKIKKNNFKQIENTFYNVKYQTLKKYNEEMNNPIISEGINQLKDFPETFTNRVDNLKKIFFSEKN